MQLFKINYLGQPIRLEGSMAGWQELFCNNELVSQKPASANTSGQYIHEFDIRVQNMVDSQDDVDGTLSGQALQTVEPSGEVVHCRIQTEVQWQPFEITYQLYVNDELMEKGKRNYKDIEQQIPFEIPQPKKPLSVAGLTAIGRKLIKSNKVIKLALLLASMAIYSMLFSPTFTAALLVSLLVHELGHVQAMRYYGLKTKGLYMIPFFAGLAMRDEKVNTRWQSVVITLMGSCFGLSVSLFYMLMYGITGNMLFGSLATFNALIGLFSLLPILPLDGGHIIKHISCSMNRKQAVIFCSMIAVIGGGISYGLALPLLLIFMLIGSVEIASAWQHRHDTHLLGLDHYGQGFSLVWYLFMVTCFIGVVWFFVGMGDDMLGLPLSLLQY